MRKYTLIKQLNEIDSRIHQIPYDELTDYLKGIRDMINLLNNEEQDDTPLWYTVAEAVNDIKYKE